MPHDPI